MPTLNLWYHCPLMTISPMIIQLITTRETIVSNPIAARKITRKLLDLQTVLLGMAKKFRLSFERAFAAWFLALKVPLLVRKMGFEMVFSIRTIQMKERGDMAIPVSMYLTTAQKTFVTYVTGLIRHSVTIMP